MNADELKAALHDGREVVLMWAPGGERARGHVVAYSLQPTVIVQTESGEQIEWVASLAHSAGDQRHSASSIEEDRWPSAE